jgi:hypothetical protein
VFVLLGGKNGKFSLRVAMFIEILALLSLIGYMILVCGAGSFWNPEGGTDKTGAFEAFSVCGWQNDGVLIAFAGTLLMVIYQCVRSKPDLGGYKVLMFILSFVAALQLFDVTLLFPLLKSPLALLAKSINSKLGFIGGQIGYTYFAEYVLDWNALQAAFKITDVKQQVFCLANIGAATMVLFNLLIDTIGLATGKYYSRKGRVKHNILSKLFGFVRYTLEFVCVLVSIIMIFIMKNIVGLYLYVLVILSLLHFMAGLLRLTEKVRNKKKVKEVAEEEAEVVEEPRQTTAVADENFDDEYKGEAQPEEQPTSVYYDGYTEGEEGEDDADEPLTRRERRALKRQARADEKAARQAEKEAMRTGAYTYDQGEEEQPYDGPTDSFIETLDNSEKYEFKDLFIDMNKGHIAGLPDYKVGGDNTKFFATIFAYLGTLKRIASDDLLGKFYQKATETK